MSKNKKETSVEVEKPKTNLPAQQKVQLPVAQGNGEWDDMRGKGFEGATADDYVMPFLKLLQVNSPEVSERGSKLKAGMMLNSVTKQAFDGEDGMIFVPVARQHVFVEWNDREKGGGLVARHEPTSKVVMDAKSSSTEFGDYRTKDGNELAEVFYLIGYTLSGLDDTSPDSVVVIPFTSTKIKRYKAIMQTLNMVKGQPPLFAHRLLLTTVQEQNKKGTFYNFQFSHPVNDSVIESMIPRFLDKERTQVNPLVQFGIELNRQVLAGQRTMADESTLREDGSGKGIKDQDIPF